MLKVNVKYSDDDRKLGCSDDGNGCSDDGKLYEFWRIWVFFNFNEENNQSTSKPIEYESAELWVSRSMSNQKYKETWVNRDQCIRSEGVNFIIPFSYPLQFPISHKTTSSLSSRLFKKMIPAVVVGAYHWYNYYYYSRYALEALNIPAVVVCAYHYYMIPAVVVCAHHYYNYRREALALGVIGMRWGILVGGDAWWVPAWQARFKWSDLGPLKPRARGPRRRCYALWKGGLAHGGDYGNQQRPPQEIFAAGH